MESAARLAGYKSFSSPVVFTILLKNKNYTHSAKVLQFKQLITIPALNLFSQAAIQAVNSSPTILESNKKYFTVTLDIHTCIPTGTGFV